MPNKSIIKVSNVTVSFGKNLILNNLEFDILEGEIFGIVGLSGSGKTTLLNTLGGVLEPVSGDIYYREEKGDMRSVRKNKIETRKMFGFASQEPSFYMKLTVKENLEFFSSMYKIPKETKAENIQTILDLVGLEHCKDLMAERLSGGMKKRLDIACSMVHHPKVLILDEPTSDLDPILRSQMLEIIRRINKKGTTIIVASHFLRDMERMCSRIGILHNKKVQIIGTPDHIKEMYTKNDEIHLETYPGRYEKILEDLKKQKIERTVNEGHKLIIYTPESIKVLHKILDIMEKRDEHLIDVEVAKPTLREVFETLIKEDKK